MKKEKKCRNRKKKMKMMEVEELQGSRKITRK